MRRLLPLGAVLAFLAVPAAPADAFRLPSVQLPLAGNPAHGLAAVEPDPEVYDAATRCDAKPKPGVERLVTWLEQNAAGVNWGTYRCEKWGKKSASLHAENRAIDWNLDVRKPAERRAGKKLLRLLLAPDRAGTPRALARRMGVEELIWDCSYWHAGSEQFGPYGPCFSKRGIR